jgi:glucose-1-phosphate cytidylyltransferase
MKTLVLCGGKGTRAYPHTVDLPKPLLEVAGRPILRHVMEIYASQGITDFVLAAGFRTDLIEAFASELPRPWDVEVVDTGLDTNTGGRVARCRERLGDTFFLTYGDGLGDVDLRATLEFHRSHAGSATVTVVPLRSQYGTIEAEPSGRVERFVEKPLLLDHWINAGFFVVDVAAFDIAWGDDLERQALPALGAAGELFAYRHTGFWRSMDTYKDALELTAVCEDGERGPEGRAPWLRSATAASS